MSKASRDRHKRRRLALSASTRLSESYITIDYVNNVLRYYDRHGIEEFRKVTFEQLQLIPMPPLPPDATRVVAIFSEESKRSAEILRQALDATPRAIKEAPASFRRDADRVFDLLNG